MLCAIMWELFRKKDKSQSFNITIIFDTLSNEMLIIIYKESIRDLISTQAFCACLLVKSCSQKEEKTKVARFTRSWLLHWDSTRLSASSLESLSLPCTLLIAYIKGKRIILCYLNVYSDILYHSDLSKNLGHKFTSSFGMITTQTSWQSSSHFASRSTAASSTIALTFCSVYCLICSDMSLRISGHTMPFNLASSPALANTFAPSARRLISSLDGVKTSSPKVSTICWKHCVPFLYASCPNRSQLMEGIPNVSRYEQRVDFPLQIPPVSPIM